MAVIALFILLIVMLAAAIALGAVVVPLFALVLIVSCGVFFFVFWIWMLIDCIRNERISGNQRILWALLIFFTHWVGGLVYFFAGRKRAVA